MTGNRTLKVLCSRFVEETAEVIVEASTPEMAVAEARKIMSAGKASWQAGDDIERERVYAVMENDEVVLDVDG